MSAAAWILFLIWATFNGLGLAATWVLTHASRAVSWRGRHDVLSPSWEEWKPRLPLIVLNLVLVLSFAEAAVWLFGEHLSWSGPGVPVQVAVFGLLLACDDAFFYAFHRFLHENDFAFLHVHHIHHRATAPLPMDYIYVHPLEWMIGAGGIALGIVSTFLLLGAVPAAAILAYAAFRNAHELAIHSGLPWRVSLFPRSMGLLAPAEYHDLHHRKLRGNYAAMLRLLDRACRTELGAAAGVASDEDGRLARAGSR